MGNEVAYNTSKDTKEEVNMKKMVPFVLALIFLTGCGAKQTVTPPAPTPAPPETLPPSETGNPPVRTATLFLPDDDAMWVELETVPLDPAGPEELLAQLEKHGAIPKNVKVNSFSEYGEGDGEVDLSVEFLSALNGTAGEEMAMSAVAYTLLANLDWNTVYLTCGGQTIETGHTIYDQPITLFSLAKVETDEVGYLHSLSDQGRLTYDEAELIWAWDQEERAEYARELEAAGEDFSQRQYAVVNSREETQSVPLTQAKIWILDGEGWKMLHTSQELDDYLSSLEEPPLFQIETEDDHVTHLIEWNWR